MGGSLARDVGSWGRKREAGSPAILSHRGCRHNRSRRIQKEGLDARKGVSIGVQRLSNQE